MVAICPGQAGPPGIGTAGRPCSPRPLTGTFTERLVFRKAIRHLFFISPTRFLSADAQCHTCRVCVITR